MSSSSPKEMGPAGGFHRPSVWWLEGTSGPSNRGTAWAQPRLKAQALPPEVQPSSESVAEWKQLDPDGQTDLDSCPNATPCRALSPSPGLGDGADVSTFLTSRGGEV